MHAYFQDILDRIPEEPTWWDETGHPRYCQFKPEHKANIYADRVKLLLICCQFCKKQFKVCLSFSPLAEVDRDNPWFTTNCYGDPPNTNCCSGTTASSISLKVLESWVMNKWEWVRVPEEEVDCIEDWAKDLL